MTHIHIIPEFKAGDPAPSGYLESHEWARAQHKAGIRQRQCPKCNLWRYPQELSGEDIGGKLICNECFFAGGSDAS